MMPTEEHELAVNVLGAPRVLTIVTQVKSNRVVYFTDDADYLPPTDGDWYYVSSTLGDLPKGMSLRNCWRWRFNGGVFTDAGAAARGAQPAALALLDHNRLALQRILIEKIDRIRAPVLPSCRMGECARQLKRDEAQAYLSDAATRTHWPMLEAAALARNITLQEAAQLVLAHAAHTEGVLRETEVVRERYTCAIERASSDQELLALREQLLDQVFPALSAGFKFQHEHTQPQKLDAPLAQPALAHEQARLRAQLREFINARRAAGVSDYLLDDVVQKHKGRIAERVLANGVLPDGVEGDVLQTYADARGITLVAAATEVLTELGTTGRLLVETEQSKDRLLADIARITTLRELRRVEKLLEGTAS